MNKRKTLIILLVLALVLAGAYIAYGRLSGKVQPDQIPDQSQAADPAEKAEESDPSAGGEEPEDTGPDRDPAPDFVFTDAEGVEYRLSDFFGTPIVLNFWASWCGPCRNELPEFDEASGELSGKVQFIMMDIADGASETVGTGSDFIAENGYGFPVFYDTSLDGCRAYGISAIPVTVFIDADGNIAAQSIGSMSGETLRQGIALIYPG